MLKEIIRKFLLTCMSVFLTWQIIMIFLQLDAHEIHSIKRILFLSGQIVLYITGIFAFVGFAFPTHKLLPERYYHIYDPKKLNRIFKILGVSRFRKFLLLTFWRSKKEQQKYFDGTVSGLENLSTQSQKSEFGHLITFVILVFVSVFFVFKGAYLLGFFVLFFNISGNLYPVILQRHHRMRMQRLSKISHRLIRRRK